MTTQQGEETPAPRENWVSFAVITALGVALCVTWALAVRPGSAGDEPAHFATVLYYLQHRHAPEVGAPGVTYQGQQAPLFYTLAALAISPGDDGSRLDYYMLRLSGVLAILSLAYATKRLAMRLGLPDGGALLAVALVVFNPSVVAMCSSVGNDALSVTLAAVTLILVARPNAPGWRFVVVLGVVLGLGGLTKATLLFLIFAVPAALVIRHGRALIERASVAGAIGAVLAAPWYIRNISVYGSLNPHKFSEPGYPPPPLPLTIRAVARNIYSIPNNFFYSTEYYRNIFNAPLVILLLVAFLCLLLVWGVFSVVRTGQHKKSAWIASLAILVAGTGELLWITLTEAEVAWRLLLPIFPLIAILLSYGVIEICRRLRLPLGAAVPVAATLLLNASLLHQVVSEPTLPFHGI